MFSRRKILQFSALGAGLLAAPRLAFAAKGDTEAKLLFILQRGAADGLATLAPYGDGQLSGLRGEVGERAGEGHKLDSTFALHPQLEGLAKIYRGGEALFVPAIASPYRDRSHFDGQNILESGGARAYSQKTGWMNRLLGLIDGGRGLALAPTVPLALRGDIPVASYAPSRLPDAGSDLMARVGDLYAEDPMLGPLWYEARAAREKAGDTDPARGGAAIGELAAKMMTGADAASLVMVESDGWDTHFQQAGRLNNQFRQLDALIATYKQDMGDAWDNTLVLVATEFGRTAAYNGTNGTDHGTGALAMMMGGGVKGGRILGDWPGLSRLHEDRDLMPTSALDGFVASAVAQHFALDFGQVAPVLFPETRPEMWQSDLIA